jgi:hypothetical protein
MTLRDAINALFRRDKPPQSTTAISGQRSAVSDQLAGAGGVSALYERMKSEQDRVAIVKLCRQMYRTDPRVNKMLRTYARDLVRSGFFVKSDNQAAAQEAMKLQTRLNLNQKLEDAVRLSGRDGDSFYEVVVSEASEVVEFTRKPTLLVRRNSDLYDRFGDPLKAFWMSRETWFGTEPPSDAIWFAEWQMIHARWDHDEENRYGTPMMAPATGAFKRVTEGEVDIAVRRKVRAGMRLLHVVEGSAADVEGYKEKNKIALENPFAAQIDLFTNKPGSITSLQGDAKLNEIDDIMHHIETMFTASDVPMPLIAYGSELNRDVLGEKRAEYEETLNQGREWATDEIIKPLLERQWLLKGIFPASVNYEVVWRTAKSLTPADIRDLADAGMRLKLLGVKDEIIQAIMAKYLPGVDIDILTGEGIDTQRYADMLKGLSI